MYIGQSHLDFVSDLHSVTHCYKLLQVHIQQPSPFLDVVYTIQ